MTSGVKTRPRLRPRAWRGIGAALLAVAAWPAQAFELAELMALLGQARSGEAQFSEQRFVQGLDQPLAASGTLSFVAPDRLLRRTLQPSAETLLVEGNTVTVTRQSRSRRFALDAAPEAVAMIEAMRATLGGDAATLQRHFRSALGGSAESWTLELVPLEAPGAGQIERVRIRGSRSELRSIETQLSGGDRSVMRIEPLRAAAGAASAP